MNSVISKIDENVRSGRSRLIIIVFFPLILSHFAEEGEIQEIGH
jgi:hypothetical protein